MKSKHCYTEADPLVSHSHTTRLFMSMEKEFPLIRKMHFQFCQSLSISKTHFFRLFFCRFCPLG